MTAPRTEPSTPDQAWGAAPAPARPGWSPGKKIGIGVAAAVVLAAGGGAAVWAATNSSSGTGSTATGGPGGAMRGGPGALGGALHGEYVASDGNGGYVTKITQTGKVTALSATSLTAQSDDGFSKTYTISGSQATGVATGDTVMVVATTSGDTATATQVTEADQLGGPGAGQLDG